MEDNQVLENTEEGAEVKEKNNLLKIILGILLILLLILGLIASVVVVKEKVSFKGKAEGPIEGNIIELANSYLFASPLKAKAGGQEKIRVTVFILDSRGRGVFGKTVILGNWEKLIINPVQSSTDEMGRAIFDIASKNKGLYVMEASVDGKAIPQKVSISFE